MRKLFVTFLIIFCLAPYALASRVWETDNQTSTASANSELTQAILLYKEKRQEYLASLNSLKAKNCKEDKDACAPEKSDLKIKALSYIRESQEVMSKYVTQTRLRVENLSCDSKSKILSNFGEWLDWLSQKEKELLEMGNEGDVSKLAESLSSFWREKETKLFQYRGAIMLCRQEKVSALLGEVANKVESQLNNLAKEYETENIESEFFLIKDKLKKAESKKNEAEKIFNALTYNSLAKFENGKNLIREASAFLKEARLELKVLLRKMDRSKLQKKSDKEASSLSIRGEGSLVLEGDINIYGKIGNESFLGSLIIKKGINGMEADVPEEATKTEKGDGTIEYQKVKEFSIKGSGMTVDITSDFIDVLVSGQGSAYIKGEGLYKASENYWTDIPKEGVTVKF